MNGIRTIKSIYFARRDLLAQSLNIIIYKRFIATLIFHGALRAVSRRGALRAVSQVRRKLGLSVALGDCLHQPSEEECEGSYTPARLHA